MRTIVKSASIGVLLSISGFAGQAVAGCIGVEAYVDGSAYVIGDQVEQNGLPYRCIVSGWCSMGGAYAPGVGWAWSKAWEPLACGSSSSSSSASSTSSTSASSSASSSSASSTSSSGMPSGPICEGLAAWDSGLVYVASDAVQHNNNKYSAKWWTLGENPTNSGQWDVWMHEGICTTSCSAAPKQGSCETTEDWIPGKVYPAGEITMQLRQLFVAESCNIDKPPREFSQAWSYAGNCAGASTSSSSGGPGGPACSVAPTFVNNCYSQALTWIPYKTYSVNSEVTSGGILYVATQCNMNKNPGNGANEEYWKAVQTCYLDGSSTSSSSSSSGSVILGE